jgi:hypothetical protein
MKYMLLIHLNDGVIPLFSGPDGGRIFAAHDALQEEMRETGELVETHELRPERSRIVRKTGGKTLVTDGPFTESKEWIAGYYVVDCESIERATELAARLVEAEFSPVEVRQLGADDIDGVQRS